MKTSTLILISGIVAALIGFLGSEDNTLFNEATSATILGVLKLAGVILTSLGAGLKIHAAAKTSE